MIGLKKDQWLTYYRRHDVWRSHQRSLGLIQTQICACRFDLICHLLGRGGNGRAKEPYGRRKNRNIEDEGYNEWMSWWRGEKKMIKTWSL